jgi:hypothetical protein
MAALTGSHTTKPSGVLGGLARSGPALIVASVLLMTTAFALTHRPWTAIPALLAGTVL